MASFILISSMIVLTMAQTTTLQIPFYGYDSFAIDASVIAVQDSVTTLTLACPSNADECGIFPAQTLTYGLSTYRMDTGAGDTFTGYQICQASVCTESAGGSSANFPGSSTTTYDSVETMPVTVTGDVALLSGSGGGGDGGAVTGSLNATQSPTTGGSATRTMASVTQSTGTAMSSSETGSASKTSSTAAQTSSGVASKSSVMLGGGLIGGVMTLLGLMLYFRDMSLF